MAEYFDPSPRASKRRKTTTHKAGRAGLEEKENETLADAPKGQSAKLNKRKPNGFDDSAYGSTEDSLVEDDASVAQSKRPEGDAIVDGEGGGSQTKEADLSDGAAENYETQDNVLTSDDEDTITVAPRASGRERKKPKRYSVSPERPKQRKSLNVEPTPKNEAKVTSARKSVPKVENTPKGILTPSRREKRIGPRKSVVFDRTEKEIEEQFGFKDIDGSSVPKSNKSQLQPKKVIPINDDNDVEVSLTPSKKSVQNRAYALLRPAGTSAEEDHDFDGFFPNGATSQFNEPVLLEQNLPDALQPSKSEDPAVLTIKQTVLARLTSHTSSPVPPHLQSQYTTLYTLLHATVTTGESNSLLLLGGRGTGKSQLLQTAIADLTAKHPDDFHAIRLNGFYQTDDKLALREIWRQLGREMQVDEMETGESGGSYADTMSSLLSLLSHADDFVDPTGETMDVDTGVVRASKSVVFVLDEFDLFTTHPRQTLLYNLFDIAQSRKAPIAVVGCSTRMDVVDCLEKRVKSRFSHRWLHVPAVKTLSDFEAIIKAAVCVETQEDVAALKLSKRDSGTRRKWNEYIETFFLQQLPTQRLIKQVFYTTKSVPELLSSLYIPIAMLQLPSTTPREEAHKIDVEYHATSAPTLLSSLSSLPALHLALLIVAARLDTIHNMTTLNFNLVYAHYVELISRSKLRVTASGAVAVGGSLRQWNRDTAQSAWEDLGVYDCVIPVFGTGAGAAGRDGASGLGDHIGGEGASVRMWRIDVTLEELNWALKVKWSESGGTRDILSKWCKEI